VSAPAGIALVRVDNRLVHGQVLEAWVPALSAQGIVVADDEVAGSALARAAMSLAIPKKVAFRVAPLAEVAGMLRPGGSGPPAPRTLILVRNVRDAVALREQGAPLPHLNLGNVHFSEGREQVTPTVYLDAGEIEALEHLGASGTEIEARAVPAEAPVSLTTLAARFRASSPKREPRK
jgi:mannose/fructose/N-acetylgalactosamine-specific phosphotransferase system component IIB